MVSWSGVVSPHIRLHAQKSLQENPQRFMGLIMMHSTQGMFNCGRVFFSPFSVFSCAFWHIQYAAMPFKEKKSIIPVFIQDF